MKINQLLSEKIKKKCEAHVKGREKRKNRRIFKISQGMKVRDFVPKNHTLGSVVEEVKKEFKDQNNGNQNPS